MFYYVIYYTTVVFVPRNVGQTFRSTKLVCVRLVRIATSIYRCTIYTES